MCGGGPMSSAWVGIDPGARGAIVAVDSDGVWSAIDMPRQSPEGAERVSGMLATLRRRLDVVVVCIEQQRAYGGQGVVSSCALGQAYGWIRGVVDSWAGCAMSSVHLVPPHEWQPAILGRRSKVGPTAKERALAVAASAAPGIALRTPRGRVLDGRADAICIALYARKVLALATDLTAREFNAQIMEADRDFH